MITPQLGPFPTSPSRSSIGALLAMAVVALGCGGAESPACPTGALLTADLRSWSEAIEKLPPAASGSPVYDALLARLGLQPLPEDGVTTLVSVAISALRAGGGKTPDRIVAARFRSAAGAESLRAQLLRPLPGGENIYCALGDELSHDKEIFEEPCLERHGGPARSFALTSLTAPDRDSIIVRDAGGWCGPGTSRGDRLSTSFWGVEDGRLVRYLEAITYEAWYESPAPPAKTRRGDIALSDSWPRVITVTETVHCRQSDEPAPLTADCQPSDSTREFRYVDKRYVAARESSPAAAGSIGTGSEEAAQ